MRRHFVAASLLVVMLALLFAGAVAAQTGSGFDLSWNVLAAGGGKMTGSGFTLSGTLGQTAVGPTAAGDFQANLGFWFRNLIFKLFLPLVLKNI